MAEHDDDPGRPVAGRRGVSRRDILLAVGGAVIGAGVVPTGTVAAERVSDTEESPATAASGSTDDPAPELRRFVSTSLTVPVVSSWSRAGTTPPAGYLFASPRTDVNNGVILQNDGEPVWIEPDGRNVMDIRVQQYQGKPVLTYWEGKVIDGYGIGAGTIKDTGYRTIGTVRPGNGLTADLHEFVFTPRGTAFLIAYPVENCDLTPIGGPRDGYILGGRIQEVDVATGDVLLDWNALDHQRVDESYQELTKSIDGSTPEAPFDAFHFNSVGDDTHGDDTHGDDTHGDNGDALLLSARHTHAIYSINRSTGAVLWRLGGRKSDFEIESGAQFSWQHDARRQADGRISLYDNHGRSGDSAVSAGLLLNVDEDAGTATPHRGFGYRDHFGYAMGNMQVQDNGNVLVGWGTEPTATEFAADGTAIYEARNLGEASYRVYRNQWSGQPDTVPDIGVRVSVDGSMRVYASWNGATEVARWRILTGTDTGSLQEAVTVLRTGFETSATVPAAKMVLVHALTANNELLAASTTRAT